MATRTSPMDRFDHFGPGILDDDELFLFLGLPSIHRTLDDIPNFWRLDHTLASLRQQGIPEREAHAFLAVQELFTRRARSKTGFNLGPKIEDSLAAAELVSLVYVNEEERFGCFYLDKRRKIIHEEIVLTGAPSMFNVTTILRRAVELKASRLIVFHTLADDEPTATPEEHAFAELLRQTCGVLEIDLADYLIMGWSSRHLSLSRKLGRNRTEGYLHRRSSPRSVSGLDDGGAVETGAEDLPN